MNWHATIASGLFAALLTSSAHADTTVVATPLPGGTSAVGAYTMSSVHGQATTLDAATAGTLLLDPGFLCVEPDDIPIPGDLNNDGHVNGIDLAVILSTWGVCGGESCAADIDRDGFVNGSDLAVVLSNWG